MKKIVVLLISMSFGLLYSQAKNCNLVKSAFVNLEVVEVNDLICISKESEKPYTVFYTFASWWKPCRLHMDDALSLGKRNDVNVFVLLVEAEDDKKITNAVDFISQKDSKAKILVLKNSVYGSSVKQRNKKFTADITPSSLETIDDFSKFILVDKQGNVMYVTNWKDYDKDWKNSKAMLERKIIPLLK